MKTPDQLEEDSAKFLHLRAMQEAAVNCQNPQDWDAAAVAILTRAIELITKKEVQIFYKNKSSI
jgi:hypothetical protein